MLGDTFNRQSSTRRETGVLGFVLVIGRSFAQASWLNCAYIQSGAVSVLSLESTFQSCCEQAGGSLGC